MASITKPLVILKPAPQLRDRIFTPAALDRLKTGYEVLDLEENPSEEAFRAALPLAFAIVGQPDLPSDVLNAATELKVVANVEGNFFANVDYPTAFRNGVRVLGCGPAYSQAVAEFALGMAIDLARGISREDRAARVGAEGYVTRGNVDSILLRRARVGFIGYGNLGRALHRLLAPFDNEIRVYDPWLPAAVLREAGLIPSSLDETLSQSTFLFVFATATTDNPHFLNRQKLALLPEKARLIAVSRANVMDYDALFEAVSSGRLLAAVDVWPEEPIPADSPFRVLDNLIISPHRAGGIPEALLSIGDMVCDDLDLVRAGLPPVRMQIAAPEVVGRYRNKPVG